MKIALCLLTWNEIDGVKHDIPLLDRNRFEQIYCIDGGSTDGTTKFHDKNHTRNTSLTRDYFSERDNFYSIGRWGSWNYSNMDMCMNEAFDVAEKVMAGPDFSNMA
jgi:hypothetical protein